MTATILADSTPARTNRLSRAHSTGGSGTKPRHVRCEATGVGFPKAPTRVTMVENNTTAVSDQPPVMAIPRDGPIGWLERQLEKVRGFRRLRRGWDSYGAMPPNPNAVFWAEVVLEAAGLNGYEPEWIEPSVEGGVMVAFRRGTNFASIECYNSGSIVALLSDGRGTIEAHTFSQSTHSIEEALSLVGVHIHA
jgi:hypothetical protein